MSFTQNTQGYTSTTHEFHTVQKGTTRKFVKNGLDQLVQVSEPIKVTRKFTRSQNSHPASCGVRVSERAFARACVCTCVARMDCWSASTFWIEQ